MAASLVASATVGFADKDKGRDPPDPPYKTDIGDKSLIPEIQSNKSVVLPYSEKSTVIKNNDISLSEPSGPDRQALSEIRNTLPASLVEAYKTSPGDFWSVFGKNKDAVDGFILHAVMDEAARMKDAIFIGILVEAARKKDDEKLLATITMDAADHLLFVSRLDEASKLYDAVIPLARSTEEKYLIARSYEGNGDIEFYRGNPSTALLMYNKAFDLYDKASNKAIVNRKSADVYVQTGDNGRAAKMLEDSLNVLKRDKNPVEEAHTYRSIAYMAMRQRDNKTATGALDLASTLYGASSHINGQADVCRALGDIALKTGNPEQAREYYAKALAIYDTTGYVIGKAYAHKGNADIAYFSGKNQEAEGLYQKSLEMFRAAGYPPGQADVLRRLGQMSLRRGLLHETSGIYETALPIYRKLKDPVGQADIYKGMGDIGYYNRNFSLALEMYDRAAPFYEQSNEPLGQGNVQRSLADIYFYTGNYVEAMEHYETALRLYIRSDSPLGQANTYRMMAETYLKLKKKDHAVAMFNSAMTLYKKTGEPIGQADIYKTLGEIYLDAGNRMGALDMFRQALKILKDTSIVDQGHAYQGIGDVYLSASDYDQALENYAYALNYYRQVQDKESEGFIMLKKAAAFERKKNIDEAIKNFDEGLAKFEQVRTQAAFSELKKSYMEKIYSHYENAAIFMLDNERNDKAFQYIEAMKARVFLDQLAESRVNIEKGIDPAMKKERDALEDELLVITRKISEESGQKVPDKDAIEKLKKDAALTQNKLDTVRREIRYKNPYYASVQYPQPISARTLQETVLKDNEVLLQYFLTKAGVYCLVIGKKGFHAIKLPVTQDELIGKIKNYLTNIQGFLRKERFREPLSQELYTILLKPAEDLVDNRNLIIVPQGILAYLPFESLLTEIDGKKAYAIEKYSIMYIQSGTVLGLLRSQYKTDGSKGSFAGFGDPVYDIREYLASQKSDKDPTPFSPGAELTRRNYVRAGVTLSRLEGTGEEIEGIRSLYEKQGSRAQGFLRLAASEENAKSPSMENYTYIHFSTHGILQPGFQAIVLSQIPGDKEDGFLTLGELMNVHFNARLVVLSACETGLGEMSNAEGVTGLTRAVMYAGSPAALVSLWNVSDEATRDLMIAFYKGITENSLTKIEALRNAKIDLLAEKTIQGFPHPFFWSAFVMYGE